VKNYYLTILIFSSILFARDFLSADLDGDGKLEKVIWKPFLKSKNGVYYRLEVYDNNRVIYKSPKIKSISSPYCIAKLNFAKALPQILEDIDSDGYYELLIPQAQSDISPTLYHILKWRDGRFIPMESKYLIFFSNRVEWMRKPPKAYGLWVNALAPSYKGSSCGSIIGYKDLDFSNLYRGLGVIRWTPGGGDVIDWAKPLNF